MQVALEGHQASGGSGGTPAGAGDAGRCRKRTKAGVYTADITYDDLKARFNMPSQKAAESLGVGLTIFKRLCRRFGLQKWPYRQLLKQQREGKRRSGGHHHRDFECTSSEEEEEAGSDGDSETQSGEEPASARAATRREPPKRRRVSGGATAKPAQPAPEPAVPAAPPPFAWDANQPAASPWTLAAQRGSVAAAAQQNVSSAAAADEPGWAAGGFSRFQQRPGSTPPGTGAAFALPSGPAGYGAPPADAALAAAAAAQLAGAKPEPGGVGDGGSFHSLWQALVRDAPGEGAAAGQAPDERALGEMREQLLRQYTGGAPPAPPTAADVKPEGGAGGQAPGSGQLFRPRAVLPPVPAGGAAAVIASGTSGSGGSGGMATSTSTQDLLLQRPMTGSLSSAFLDSLLLPYASMAATPGSGATPSSRAPGACAGAPAAALPWQAQRLAALGQGGGGGGGGPTPFAAGAARAPSLPPHASLLLSAAAAGVSLPLPSPLPPASARDAAAELAQATSLLPRAGSSWWALDSPLTRGPTPLEPQQHQAALAQEQRALKEQGAALSQLIGSLKREIGAIEQRSAALEAEAERARRAAAAGGARRDALRAAQAEQERQLAGLLAQQAQQEDLTPSERVVLAQLIAGLRQEIHEIQAQLAAEQRPGAPRGAALPRRAGLPLPPAAPEGGAAAASGQQPRAVAGQQPPQQGALEGQGWGSGGLSSPSTAVAFPGRPDSLPASAASESAGSAGARPGSPTARAANGGASWRPPLPPLGDEEADLRAFAAAKQQQRSAAQLQTLQALLQQQQQQQQEQQPGGAAQPGGGGHQGSAPASAGLTPATPSERAGSDGGAGEGEGAASGFLARVSAVHGLQQRLAAHSAQRRQRAIAAMQARFGGAQALLEAQAAALAEAGGDPELAAARLAAAAKAMPSEAQLSGLGPTRRPPQPADAAGAAAAAAADLLGDGGGSGEAPGGEAQAPAAPAASREPEASLAYQLLAGQTSSRSISLPSPTTASLDLQQLGSSAKQVPAERLAAAPAVHGQPAAA